jgi:hypothetical protein
MTKVIHDLSRLQGLHIHLAWFYLCRLNKVIRVFYLCRTKKLVLVDYVNIRFVAYRCCKDNA